MKKKCVICKNEFEATRSDAEVCSSACRQKHWRNKKEGKKEPLMTAEEYWKTLQSGPELSSFLLRHSNHETVRNCCLHFLGDEYQKLGVFLKESGASADEIIGGFMAHKARYSGIEEALKNQPAITTSTSGLVKEEPPKFNQAKIPPTGLKGIDLAIWKAENKKIPN